MLPAGYIYKRVAAGSPEWIGAGVENVYSVSGCVSEFFADYVPFWRHNGFWFFDSPTVIEELAADNGIDLSALTLFYYEVYEEEFDKTTRRWSAIGPDGAFATNVIVPAVKELLGFDVVTFSSRTAPECSPLSCNGLADAVPVNRHCLFDAFSDAKEALERGVFDQSEPGPHRIVAVYRIAGR